MKYAFLLYSDEDWLNLTGEEQFAYVAPYLAYTQALRDADVFVAGEPLEASAGAKTVRVRGGETHVEDGPFADAREQLGGFYIVTAPDLDAALGKAASCPGATHGTVEIRPVLEMGSTDA